MIITPRFEFVDGSFDTENIEMVCVVNRKYGLVELCVREKQSMNVPIAKIKLYSRPLAIDADAVFEDASNLGKEIARRWNECIDKK